MAGRGFGSVREGTRKRNLNYKMSSSVTPRTFDLIVIGAGPAGVAAALRGGALGARVALIDRHRLGGTCNNTGCVPTRVLAITARLLRDIRGAAAYGIEVGPPSLHWPGAVKKVRHVIAEIQDTKRVEARLREVGGELFLEGEASLVDPNTVRLADSGRELTAPKLVLAVGGKARRLPFPGSELTMTLDELIDLDELPGSVTIVGSGYTGVQLTTILNAFGVKVTLLEMAPNILPLADADVSRALRESFERQGVRVVTGIASVDSVVQKGPNAKELSYGLDGKATSLETEEVILAVGWPADLAVLGPEAAGVELVRGFVKMNAQLQTTMPHIYVAGDANGRDMLVQGAVFEGELAAENAVLGQSVEYHHLPLPSGGFTDPDHAGVGITEAQAQESGQPYHVAVARYSDLDRAIIDSRKVGFFKLIAEPLTGRILGAHAAGENAVEVMQAVATSMRAGATASLLASVRFAYPTYSAIIGEAARKLAAAS